MRTAYCERCPDEDTDRCLICDGYGHDRMENELSDILQLERERIGGKPIDRTGVEPIQTDQA